MSGSDVKRREPRAGKGPSGRLIGKKADPAETGLSWLQAPASDQETIAQGPQWQRDAPRLVVPSHLGPYAIQNEVARGGMGIVLRAYHTRLERDVAIKLLRPEAAEDDSSVDRFMREARATAQLRHPGIVAIHDVVHDEEGRTYLVMDFVHGQSLKQLLAKGPIAPRRAAQILRDVGQAVHHAHEHGILHRDLKPDNVLIDERTEAPLLTDFGLAKGLQRDMADTARAASGARGAGIDDADLTQYGEVIGTPLYMAPEQIDPDLAPTGPGVDVYALGAVLYESLTGQPPFVGESVMAIFDKALRDDPQPPRALNPLIPGELEGIVLRCLAKAPADRYASALAVSKALERFLGSAATIQRTVRIDSGQGGSRFGALLACLALGLGGAWWFGLGSSRAEPPPPGPEAAAVDSAASERAAAPRPEPVAPSRAAGAGPKLLNRGASLTEAPVLARQGYADVQLTFGLAILQGKYPALEPPEGLKWLERAAQAGYPPAVIQLAAIHQKGVPGIPASRRAMLRWLRFGAELRQPEATLHLGLALASSHEPAERAEAERWLDQVLAADPDQHQAAVTLAGLIQHREPARARGLLERAAEAGDLNAMLNLSVIYQRGLGTAPDPSAALAWINRAARKDDPRALFLLGRAYERGLLGLRPDRAAALRWYRKAAAHDHADAKQAVRRLGS